MIARTIVDVPAAQTDRLFDYLIPSHLEDIIQPGMRVVVPFGASDSRICHGGHTDE